ncbi:hypothetical protein I6A84_43665 [Frankia sp. CNm7]|uniref:ABC transporter permease n=1 Tax=Frankia nepalensis TaxID=1836974 RepID=A0A937RV01_9ACTN|nr:hypothetical protein [Frankia nepalensis]MBL7498402.1 hypothetical protein [Frankia nepalensis]MBL7512050.1 hypothetical protein [Frankia nepalensis]MBL7524762.1 hypothetical protein [Frankia nepalensis]MBL7632381.1 hypothetical protein [Frankia nepalensis]
MTTFVPLLRAERRSLRGRRATKRTLVVTVLLTSVLGFVLGALMIEGAEASEYFTAQDHVHSSLLVVRLTQFALAVLGVLAATGRRPVTPGDRAAGPAARFAARALAFALKAFAISAASVFGMFLWSMMLFDGAKDYYGNDFGTTLTQPGVARALAFATLHVTAMALLGFALGTLLRRRAIAIPVTVTLIITFVVLITVSGQLRHVLPDPTLIAVGTLDPDAEPPVVDRPYPGPSPLGALLVPLGWTALLLAGAAVSALFGRSTAKPTVQGSAGTTADG